jgi:glycosyltransferase involved in cell wall biosynthesis
MLRVLALTKYDRMAASARMRFVQFEPGLKERGIELSISPLFDDRYLKERFASGRQKPEHVLRALVRRARALVEARSWDLAVVCYELFPYLPPLFEQAALLGLPYVFDFDDAIFHTYDQHPRALVRRVLGDKLSRVIRGARSVIAGSDYLAEYARRSNPKVHLIPTVIDLDRYRVRSTPRRAGPFTVGWIGSPSTSTYLDLVAGPLVRLAQEGPVKLLAVGAAPRTIPGVEVEIRPWSEAREVEDLLECDVGIMPLTDTPWSRGKCAFKLIQYMACGLPVVASPVGANQEVVNLDCGAFARDDQEWLTELRRLRDTPSLAEAQGRAGRARAEARYSLQSQLDPLAQIFRQAVG